MDYWPSKTRSPSSEPHNVRFNRSNSTAEIRPLQNTTLLDMRASSSSSIHHPFSFLPSQRSPKTQCCDRMIDRRMAESNGLKMPVFTKVAELRPGATGLNVEVKVVNSKLVMQKGRPDGPQRQMRIAECLVGDETGMIVFTARNDLVELMKEGNTVILRNAKIDMYKGSMRLAVDKWGRVEVIESALFVLKEENNLSLIEFELLNVVE
ncbi:hypothetical protein QQ045_019237 [Rhodiola kirilowii]